MKILFLAAYFIPERAASSYLSVNRNQAFADAGFNMVVYTPIPTRGVSDEIRQEYKKRKLEKLFDDKMIVHRFALMREGSNSIKRAFRYVLNCIKLCCFGIFAKDARSCNIMFISSTPPIQGAMAALIKKCRKIPFVYNLQDIFPDSLVGTGMTKKGSFLWKIGRMIENFTYRNADKIIVISEDFKKNIMAKGVPEEKIEVIYNWIDEKAVVPIARENNPLYEELGLNREKFNVVYAGNLGNAQNIDVIIDSAKELVENKNIEFIIFGSGGLKEQFVKKVKDYGIDNVKFFPLQPMERVSYVYGLGNICIVSCKPGLGGSAMPSKTMSILSAGSAILASFDEGDLTSILEQNDCGVCAKAGDVKGFVEKIKMLAANREKCDIMGKNGRKLILQKFTREVGTQKYVDVIKNII